MTQKCEQFRTKDFLIFWGILGLYIYIEREILIYIFPQAGDWGATQRHAVRLKTRACRQMLRIKSHPKSFQMLENNKRYIYIYIYIYICFQRFSMIPHQKE